MRFLDDFAGQMVQRFSAQVVGADAQVDGPDLRVLAAVSVIALFLVEVFGVKRGGNIFHFAGKALRVFGLVLGRGELV